MILLVDPHSGIPVYRQLMDQIRFHIASGMVQPGEEIPSTRALSARLGVNPMTVSKAYAQLEEEGLLERRPGLPLIVRQRQESHLETTKLDRLESDLRPIATRARQLGIDSNDAVVLFRRLLESEEE